ncbi:MAG: L-amino acid N-acyltransferase YncA [Arenicella sp.]|jgi:L-amino acid N-acyltransferase YncA
MKIRAAENKDAAVIAEIYSYYIATTTITFEEAAVTALDIQQRIADTRAAQLPYLVVVDESDLVLGYAYASKWKGRCAYRYTAEVTVYLGSGAAGKGLASGLYSQLFERLRQGSYHVAIAGISLPNAASIALHEKFGMRKVAHFSQVGFKFGNWVDVGYWQCELNAVAEPKVTE